MAEEFDSTEDRTEDPTPERREEFRDRGQIAVSREITSVLVLAGVVLFLTYYVPKLFLDMKRLFIHHFQDIVTFRVEREGILHFANSTWIELLYAIVPLFLVSSAIACFGTFSQTRLNWSWQRLTPDFSRIDPIRGLARMFTGYSILESGKSIVKMLIVGIVAWLILYSEWMKVPVLMYFPVSQTFSYWGEITKVLFWSVSSLMLVIGGVDYFYNYLTLERRLKMTKQEVKEEYKRREIDPHVKARIKRLQRDIGMRKIVERTKTATVVITNPTHYSIAIKYNLGMRAPVVVAKGLDFLALRMREIAKEFDIPIIENKPLARTLYKIVELDQEIPESLYKAVSEMIKYVFNIKGIRLNKKKNKQDTTRHTEPPT